VYLNLLKGILSRSYYKCSRGNLDRRCWYINGIISGFTDPTYFTGNTYNANDAVTAQCRFDLFRLYIHLNDLFVDYPATHAVPLLEVEKHYAGVYSIPGAGSIGTSLNLDGGGNPMLSL
jgi:hypothetical protein